MLLKCTCEGAMIDYNLPICTEFTEGEHMCKAFRFIINALRLLYHKNWVVSIALVLTAGHVRVIIIVTITIF